jgi:hypothetical protein
MPQLLNRDSFSAERFSLQRIRPNHMSTSSDSTFNPASTSDVVPINSEVPLADLPLVADHQKTVVSSQSDSVDSPPGPLTAISSNGEHRQAEDPSEVLFSAAGSDTIPGAVRLDHFQVRRRIGSGGMGKVFLADDTTLRRPVALKVLNPGAVNDSALLARFQNEARSAALLRHDNIAQVYYTGESHGIHFIACEYVVGKTIRELLEEDETLPVDLVVNYAVQATLALNHMHASGVIHRDIKPSNIIVSDEGRVKLVDFGLARRESEGSTYDITVAGSILGTFDYMAPEQAREASEADIRSDIYSLGCTLYHMLTGQPPYPEGNAVQKLLDHSGKQAPDPAHINNRVPREIAAIVLTMMKTDPADRFQTPAELLTELIEVATEMGLQGVPADGIVWQHVEEPAIRQLSGAMVLLAGVIIFCITAFTLHSMKPVQPPLLALENVGHTDVDQSNTSQNQEDPESLDSKMTGGVAPAAITEPPANTVKQVPEATAKDPFIVHTSDQEPIPCKTLAEALTADPGSIEIELAFTGLLPRPITSLPRLERKSVHLYAAKGCQPVLELNGSTNDSTATKATSMFTLTNSNLTLEGIALRLIPSADSDDSTWSIFDCSGSTKLALTNCSIDVATGGNTEICRLKESTSDQETQHVTDVHLENVIVRGAADMFHIEAPTTGDIHLKHCGLGIDGCLVNNTGSASMNGPGSLNITLEHVTCILGAPLIRIDETEQPNTRLVISSIQVTSRASVFCSVAENGTLVESYGTDTVTESLDDLTELLSWNGDTNLYSQIDTFWALRAPNAAPAKRDYDWNEWTTYWGSASRTRGTGAREDNGTPFEWIDALWKTPTGETSHLDQLEPDWLTIVFEGTSELPELPKFQIHESPGVMKRLLPNFPEPLTTQESLLE